MPVCNQTSATEALDEQALFSSHPWTTFHHVAETIAAVFGLIAICVSLFLMFMHMTHYSRPREQRHIVRILFMVPIYALVSYLSIVFYTHSVYYEVLRDCYEAFAIASFFSLMCAYIAPDLHSQKEYFRTIRPKNWIWPLPWFQKCTGGQNKGPFRIPGSGLTWFNVIWVAIFQYCFIRVSMTIVAVLSQYWNRYCLESLNPGFAHVWVMCIEGVAVTITMFCLIQFYIQVRNDIAQHKPLLKVISIKLVIFLSFWQTILISFLTSTGVFHSTHYVSPPDIKVTLPALILCIEMALFAVLHIFSFPWQPYHIGSAAFIAANSNPKEVETARYHGGPLGIKAFLDCFNPWDLIKAVGRSAKWLAVGRRHRRNDPSYQMMENGNKLNEISAYAGATTLAGDGPQKVHEHQGLMHEMPPQHYANQTASSPRPYDTHAKIPTHMSDSSGSGSDGAWQEVEKKEYLADERSRRQEKRNDGFPPHHTTQSTYPEKGRYYETTTYDTRYNETAYAHPTGAPTNPTHNTDSAPPYPIGTAITTNTDHRTQKNPTSYTISSPTRTDTYEPETQGRPPSVLMPGHGRGGNAAAPQNGNFI